MDTNLHNFALNLRIVAPVGDGGLRLGHIYLVLALQDIMLCDQLIIDH